jgi:hypothetical protein
MLHFKNKGWQLTSVVILFTILFSSASFAQFERLGAPENSPVNTSIAEFRLNEARAAAIKNGHHNLIPEINRLAGILGHIQTLNNSHNYSKAHAEMARLAPQIVQVEAKAKRPRPVQRVERRPEPRPEPRPAHRRGWGRKVSRTDFAVLYDKINHAKRMAKRRGLYHRFRYKLNSVTSDFFAAKRINRRGHYRRAREMYDRTLGRTEHIIRQIRRKGRRSWR